MPRLTRDDIEFARRHRLRRAGGQGRAPFVTLRVAHLRRWFLERYASSGGVLPDDADGRLCLRLQLDHLANTVEPRRRMIGCANTWAPWMHNDEREALVDQVLARPRRYRADTLARLLSVTDADRRRLKLWTIGAIDRTAEQRKQDRRTRSRDAKEAQRRADGVKPRILYLTELLARPKPWASAGMSRASWYRAGKPETRAA